MNMATAARPIGVWAAATTLFSITTRNSLVCFGLPDQKKLGFDMPKSFAFNYEL